MTLASYWKQVREAHERYGNDEYRSASDLTLVYHALPQALARIEELEAALFIAQQMSNCVYNALQNEENWERAKKSLAELLPQFDTAMRKP